MVLCGDPNSIFWWSLLNSKSLSNICKDTTLTIIKKREVQKNYHRKNTQFIDCIYLTAFKCAIKTPVQPILSKLITTSVGFMSQEQWLITACHFLCTTQQYIFKSPLQFGNFSQNWLCYIILESSSSSRTKIVNWRE